MEAKGINGQIKVTDDEIIISRKGVLGLMLQGLAGEKSIYIASISSIQFKRAGMMAHGYIQFAFDGGREAHGGLNAAVLDENSVVYKKAQQEAFDAVHEAIKAKRAARKRQESGPRTSLADEIEKLSVLRDREIIDDAEFQAKKRQLLAAL